MKVSLRDLEAARTNPGGFSQRPAVFYGGPSKYRVLQFAALEFHRLHEDSQAAHVYFRDLFTRSFKNVSDMQSYEAQLTRYCQGVSTLGMTVAKIRMRIFIKVGARLDIVGEIPRLDLTADGGYAVWLFGKRQCQWRSELRWPVLQEYFATTMGVTAGLVSVGTYFFEAGIYEQTRYSAAEIIQARAECRKLDRSIS
jgi:hypothetical protein